MTIEELEQIAQSVRQENAKYDYEVNVCMDWPAPASARTS